MKRFDEAWIAALARATTVSVDQPLTKVGAKSEQQSNPTVK